MSEVKTAMSEVKTAMSEVKTAMSGKTTAMSESTTAMSESKFNGSCLCGGIQYEVNGKIGDITFCHCSMCQKEHGAPFGTYAPVSFEDFALTRGQALLKSYRSSTDVCRTFCGNCGSTLQFVRDNRPTFGLAVCTLDSVIHNKPVRQIFTKFKAPWFKLAEEPPGHEAWS